MAPRRRGPADRLQSAVRRSVRSTSSQPLSSCSLRTGSTWKPTCCASAQIDRVSRSIRSTGVDVANFEPTIRSVSKLRRTIGSNPRVAVRSDRPFNGNRCSDKGKFHSDAGAARDVNMSKCALNQRSLQMPLNQRLYRKFACWHGVSLRSRQALSPVPRAFRD
jgi:hypothetical protein